MIVADTNIVAYFLLPGDETPRVEALRAKEKLWRAPALFRHEWLNVVTNYVYRKLLSRDEAIRVFRRGIALVEIDESIPDPVRIINLHEASGCASYDCQFVALAEDLSVKLITFDQQILRAFPHMAVTPEGI
jgi:predicted nucleic acid-binding protein